MVQSDKIQCTNQLNKLNKQSKETTIMKITTETSLNNFEFWSSAKHNASLLTSAQLDAIESTLDEVYPDGMSDTELNDLFWHDFDTVLDWIGTDYETLTESN
jgi:hypothetical protein